MDTDGPRSGCFGSQVRPRRPRCATAAPVAPATVGLPPTASAVEFAAGYTGVAMASGDELLACAGLPFAPLPPSLTVALFGSVRTLAIRCEAPRVASGACLRVADALSCIPATPAAAQLKTRTIATDRLPHIGPFERLAPTLSDRSECRSALAASPVRALVLSPRKTRHDSACRRAHHHLAQ